MSKDRARPGLDFGIRVGAVILDESGILLVRHAKPDREPYWVLPGGRLEPHETIPECAEREVLEEVGLRGCFLEVLYLSEFMREDRHTVDVTVRVEAAGEARLGSDPELEPGAEPTLREVRRVSGEELRGIPLLPPALKRQILEDLFDGDGPRNVYLRSEP
jgi:8-oxo-dGTP diphosphatase